MVCGHGAAALGALANEPRWVAWRNEPRGGRSTKIPYAPDGKRAKADDPATWGTRDVAQHRAAKIVNRLGGGIGFMLGEASDGLAFGGVDLDTCRSLDNSFESWACEVIERFASYAEISPSGTGAKIFFRYHFADLPKLRSAMGTQHGREFKRQNGNHPPAIELHLSNRYFTVTEQHLEGSPDELTIVDKEILLWLIRDAGPSFSGVRGSNKTNGSDNSRSAIAFRIGLAMRRAGRDFEEFCEALHTDPRTAKWYAEKGVAIGGRELHRIWQRADAKTEAPQAEWISRAQRDRQSEPRSNFYNTMLALREDARMVRSRFRAVCGIELAVRR